MLDGNEAVKKRFTALDALRGFIIWHMVIFHGLYDINVIGGLNPLWPSLPPIALWQEIGLCIFVMLAGSSFLLMKAGKRWLHGLKLNAMGLVITAITYIMMPEEVIFFGVLSFMGCAVWVTMLLENSRWQLLSKVSAPMGLLVCLLLYSITMHINDGYLGFASWKIAELPEAWYGSWTAAFGLPGAEFSSADYVPLLPYIFIYCGGGFAFRLIKSHCPAFLQTMNWPILLWPGKHSLAVYFLHQPVLLVCLGLL